MGQYIMRLARKEVIKNDFLKKEITFSCPANWHNYAVKDHNQTIGDQLECVYAHVRYDDSRVNEYDKDGKPMGNNLTTLFDDRDNSLYLRHEPILLTPTLCFFQRLIEKTTIKRDGIIVIDLAQYCMELGYKLDEVYFLVIRDPKGFENDLIQNIPVAVDTNADKLIFDGTDGFFTPFNRNSPINYNNVDYNKIDYDDIFYEKDSRGAEMWWKQNKYQNQCEGRVTIKNVLFKQRYSDSLSYKWEENTLKVKLPNIQQYAGIVDPSKASKIHIRIENGELKLDAAWIT